jgi:hypothetical protein
VAHAIGYSMLSGGIVPEVGSIVVEEGFDIVVDVEMVMHAQGYASYVRSLGGVQKYEQRVSLEWLVGGLWGTADAIVHDVDNDELHVVDLKYGQGVFVDAVDNMQLLIYGLAALGEDNWLDIKRINMHIYQPRMDNVCMWTVPVCDLDAYKDRLVKASCAIIAAREHPDRHLHAGPHCRWCPQKAKCLGLERHAIEKAQATFGPVEKLPHGVISDILDHAEMIDLWISAVRAEAYKRAERGECPGWKLVPKRPTRQWISESSIRAASVSSGVNIFGERPLLSPAQLEKTMGKRAFAEHFSPLVTSISSGLKLARESEPGVAVMADQVAALTFGAVQPQGVALLD